MLVVLPYLRVLNLRLVKHSIDIYQNRVGIQSCILKLALYHCREYNNKTVMEDVRNKLVVNLKKE